MYHSHIKID